MCASGVVENVKVHRVLATGNVCCQYMCCCVTGDGNCFAQYLFNALYGAQMLKALSLPVLSVLKKLRKIHREF